MAPEPEARTVELETPDGPMPVYEVIPDAPRGAVVVIQEVFGVNHHIQDVTRRFADAGYHAVAPHLFHRTGSPELGYDDFSKVMPHMQALTDDKLLQDVEATVAHLSAARDGVPRNQATAEKLIMQMQTALQAFCGLWLAAAASRADRQQALSALSGAVKTARSWGAPLAAWPGWSS